MQTQALKPGKSSGLFLSCSKCGHVRVCTIFRAVGPLLEQNWTEESRPFDPNSIASICKEYVSGEALAALIQPEEVGKDADHPSRWT